VTGTLPAQRTVAKPKITDYLLKKRHEIGGPKAAFFSSFGFVTEQWPEMAEALIAHPERNSVEMTIPTPYGTKFVVRCTLETPDGRNPCIRTVWMDEGKGSAALVTAYPAE
jgi:hypothetical protein